MIRDLINRIKKDTAVASAIFALGLPGILNAQSIEGKVLFYADTKTIDGVVTNEFRPGDKFTFTAYANNQGLSGEKVGYVGANIHSTLLLEGMMPIEGQHYGTNDVFYPLVLEENKIEVSKISRATQFNLFPFGRDGFSNREGVFAIFTGEVPAEAKSGQYPIQLVIGRIAGDMTPEHGDPTYYPAHVRNFSIAVKNPEDARPVVALTSDRENEYVVHVAANPEHTATLSRSYNMADWLNVASGRGSFDWVDNEAVNNPYTFYKAVSAP